MKRFFILVFAFVLLFSGCDVKEEPEEINIPYLSSEESSSSYVSGSVPLPHVFIDGKHYYTFPDFPDCGISDENFDSEGYLRYTETKNIRRLGDREGNHAAFSGSSYAFIGDTLYVKVFIRENGSVFRRWVEMIPVGSISSTETSKKADYSSADSTTSCVPEISVSSVSSSPSHSHSSDTSSDISSPENIHYIKGRVVNTLPEISGSPDASLGNEDVLKRWYFAIADTSDISLLLIKSAAADKYELHFDDTSAVIETLQSVTPGISPKTDNPAAGASRTVAAFDENEKELWRVSLDGYRFIVRFGGENASYVFDMSGQDYSKIIGIGNYVSSMSRP